MSPILRESGLGLFGRGGKSRPGVAVTFATARGDIRPASAVVTGLGCRVRYEVDMSDHRDEVCWALPSRDERTFTARIEVGWRVCDPCEITRRRVPDGFSVILGHLRPAVRRLARVLTVEDRHGLEDRINELVLAGPVRCAEGVEAYHLDARVSVDSHTDLSTARSRSDLDELRRRAVEQMVRGDNGPLLHHLTVHREDTVNVANLLARQNGARAQLLGQFTDRLLPEELEGLAELVVRHTTRPVERPHRCFRWPGA